MRILLYLVLGFDAVCLLWLAGISLQGPRRIFGRTALFLPPAVCYSAAGLLGVAARRSEDVGLLLPFLLLWLIYCGALTILTGLRLRQAQSAAQTRRQLERHFAQREEYYEELMRKQEQTRALWHDMEKYLHAAEAEAGRSPAIEQARAALAEASDLVDVGNRVLNVIFSEYRARARAAGIDLDLQVQTPDPLFVAAADLYILLGNPLDNAINACLALEPGRRWIHLTLRRQNDVLFFSLTNPCGPGSTEQGRDGHGYGLQNVRACIKKYGGAMETSRENGCFTFSAHLNVPDTQGAAKNRA